LEAIVDAIPAATYRTFINLTANITFEAIMDAIPAAIYRTFVDSTASITFEAIMDAIPAAIYITFANSKRLTKQRTVIRAVFETILAAIFCAFIHAL
jgi:uncharacterized membrane protein